MSPPPTDELAAVPEPPALGAPHASEPPGPPLIREPSLRERAKRGAMWSMLGYGGSQMLRFASNVLLTRLLFEEHFGMMALVGLYLQLVQLFSDVGISPSIVQSKQGDDPRFLDTAWTIQVSRGVILWLVCCLGAWPFARFYEEPTLAVILPVSGLTAILSGFWSTKLYTLNRHLAMGRLMGIELFSQICSIVAMATWAFISPTIWALVAGGITASLVKLVMSHLSLPGHRNRFHWDRESARSLFGFGKWIFLSTILTFLAGQSDKFVFGKLVGMKSLGVYHIATQIALIPQTTLGHLGHSIVFPVYSRVIAAGNELAPMFNKVRLPLMLLAGWMVSGLIAGGQTAVEVFYDDRYLDAGWIVQMLAFGGWLFLLEATNGAALLARGEAQWVAAANGGKTLGLVILIPIGYHFWGFPGAVGGFAGAEFFKYGVSAWSTSRVGLAGWPQDILLTGVVLVVGAVGYYAAHLVAPHTPGLVEGTYAVGLVERLGVHGPVTVVAKLVEGLVVAGVVSLLWLPAGLYWRRLHRAPSAA